VLVWTMRRKENDMERHEKMEDKEEHVEGGEKNG
jgi:hypothetical protein